MNYSSITKFRSMNLRPLRDTAKIGKKSDTRCITESMNLLLNAKKSRVVWKKKKKTTNSLMRDRRRFTAALPIKTLDVFTTPWFRFFDGRYYEYTRYFTRCAKKKKESLRSVATNSEKRYLSFPQVFIGDKKIGFMETVIIDHKILRTLKVRRSIDNPHDFIPRLENSPPRWSWRTVCRGPRSAWPRNRSCCKARAPRKPWGSSSPCW